MPLPRSNRLVAAAILVAAVLWTGCEGSPVPLSDPPSVPVDAALAGTWELATDDGSPGDRADVFLFNRFEYLVEYREASTADDGSVTYDEFQRVRMFMTDVDGRTFVNVSCIDCEDREWLFLELSNVASERVELDVVSDRLYRDLDDEATPDGVLAALRALLTQPGAVGDRAVFRRVDG